MRNFVEKHLWWLVAVVAAVLLLAHTTGRYSLTVDSTSLVLLALILVSPFVSSLKKIKVGDFEAEIDPKEVRQVKEQASSLNVETSNDDDGLPEADTLQQIRELGTTDHVLALAKLRIELEHIIDRIYQHARNQVRGRHQQHRALMSMVRDLIARDVLSGTFEEPFARVVSICNRAIHGQEIRREDASTIIDIGCSLLDRLYDHTRNFLLDPNEQEVIDTATVTRLQAARYRVTTVVPLVTNPLRYVRILDQESLDDLLDGYHEYAEFIVGIEAIDDEDSV